MIQTVVQTLHLVLYADGERRYILAPKGLKAGDSDPVWCRRAN